MSEIQVELEFRRKLWSAGWGEIDSSFRFALVELELWFFGSSPHWATLSDGEQRHVTNCLVWADTALAGANRAIDRAGTQGLRQRWDSLQAKPIRSAMRDLRNTALKERRNPAPLHVEFDDRVVTMEPRLERTGVGTPAYGTCEDYLRWIQAEAFPLVVEAITSGSRGPIEVDGSLPITDQMPFPYADPWTSSCDPEVAAVLLAVRARQS